jgi:hypothetical protein
MPWVEVECPNEKCPGREVTHTTECRCKGSGRVMDDDPHTYIDCPEEPVIIPARWSANYRPARAHEPGDFDNTIHCPSCGTEGVEGDV